MNRYTIYCTDEQTKKALKLGAPIYNMQSNISVNGCGWFDYKGKSYLCPTAEQMIGWLNEQDILVSILFGYEVSEKWAFDIDGNEWIEFTSGEYNSRKEATIAAIDTALDYLLNKNEE